ncbi:MAG: type IV secretory system conjugative DNA transfer family protein [Oscillospiraceae bacterium]|nr:type IV secretory system conjugative DNA transfer family protein [Oscillospiraceae bacterium]
MAIDKVILGKDCVYPADPELTGLNNNVIVLGGSGSGKTQSIVVPHLLETFNSSLVVSLSKRRIAEEFTPVFEERGYKVLLLDFSDPDRSNVGWDPLDFVHDEEDITFLAEALIKSDAKKSHSTADPYWDQAAVTLLSSLIALVQTQPDPSFSDVMDKVDSLLINADDDLTTTTLDDCFNELEKKNPKCFAVNAWRTFRMLPIRTSLCVYSDMNVNLATLFTKRIRRLLQKKPAINFERIAAERTVLFTIMSPVNPGLNRLINVCFSQLLKQLFELAESEPNGRLPVPVHLIFDDFATAGGGQIMKFPELISSFREPGISCTLIMQSESQLEYLYKAGAHVILENADSLLYLGGMDLDTARNAGLRADLPMEEMLWMPIGQEYVFRRGQKPIRTLRYDTPGDPRYQAIHSAWEQRAARQPTRIARWEAAPSDTAHDPGVQMRTEAAQSPSKVAAETLRQDESASPEQLLERTEKLVKAYAEAGQVEQEAEMLEDLAFYSLMIHGESDEKTLDAVQRIAWQLATLGAYRRAEHVASRLFPLRVRVNGRDNPKTLKVLAISAVIYEHLAERRKANNTMGKLAALGKKTMPELVKITAEECERIREERRK